MQIVPILILKRFDDLFYILHFKLAQNECNKKAEGNDGSRYTTGNN